MKWNAGIWEKSIEEFKGFMVPLVRGLGRSERRVAATRYVEGLLLPGERKSIDPMAQRLGVDAQSLQQFITDSPWSEEAMWRAIRQEIIPHLEPIEAWVVDETGWLKQGKHSVGVSHQYCGAVGKNANCQVSVEVAVSNGWVAAPIAARLYLPKSWMQDRERCQAAGVPLEVTFQSKPEIAVGLIREALADGVAAAPILADSVYGDSTDFRARLRDMKLEFFLQVTPTAHKGWMEPVKTYVKRSWRYVAATAPPPRTLQELAATIEDRKWRHCQWTAADGKVRSTRLAWMEVWLAHNLRQGKELEKVWLVIDWPADQQTPYHYYLAHFHRRPHKARCLKLSRSRWHIEQYYQRSKDDLGLDHFEGRSWRGFHHHLVLSSAAYLFVLILYLRNKKNFWAHVGTDAAPDSPVLTEISRLLLLLRNQI